MRLAVLFALVAVPLAASAGPFRDVIKQPAKRAEPGAPKAFTNVSRTLFLNPCLPDGCTVTPSQIEDSRTNKSSIPNNTALLTAWPHGQIAWDRLVQCVKDMYAPFDIQVTDVDPGTANHFEVMMAGNANVLGVPGAGGVAPFIACNGNIPNNVISFVFAADISNQDFLCWAAAQESAHVWGLDHELNAKDPMTYLTPPIKKEGFQNTASPCGEEADQARECWCGGTTQNSFQYLMDTFGPANLEPASMAITEPADGAWVRPGFNVKFAVMSQLSVVSAQLSVDGTQTSSLANGASQVFATPSDLAAGDHTITVVAKDTAQREVTSQITVHVTAKCDAQTACAKSFNCLGGFCLPGADVTGGLGSPCTNNTECVTGVCGGDGTNMLCTGACDSGSTCPSGYACLEASGGAGVCWPSPEDEGGCSSSGGNSPLLALLGLSALVLITRRRK